MSDDIVTRLREMWGDDDRCIWCKKHMDSQSIPHREVCDLMEAADEIERLRASVINTSDNAFDEIERLRVDRDRWAVVAERLYDIMLAHETVSDDDWNQGLHDCWLLLVGDTTNE